MYAVMSWINCWPEKTRKSNANSRSDKAFTPNLAISPVIHSYRADKLSP